MFFYHRAFFLASLCLSWVTVHAQPLPTALPMPLAASPADSMPIQMDGLLNDAAWAAATPFDSFRRFRPNTQTDVAPYRTEVRVLMERGALVFGIRAWDPDPAEIRAPLSRRDKIFPDQDAVTVWLDPNGRSEVAQFVRVNAAGAMTDGVYRASDGEEDVTPDYLDVEVATHRLADGYSVEIRWPLSVLRYPLNGKLPWGVMVTRRVPREVNMAFASAPVERTHPHLLTQLQRFDIDAPLREQLDGEQHLRLRAEGTARRLDDGAGTQQATNNLGLELQWRPRADWVVDAIVRPDFSQVELDEPQLAGNTRYALFQTEKRTFFLESSDVVGQLPPDNWGISRGLLAFYSRAITDPRWGVRATYRGNDSEGTAMVLQDAGGGLVLRPSAFGTASYAVDQASTVAFVRHRTQVGEKASVAGILSVREWSPGIGTELIGVDGQVEVDDVNQLRGHFLVSQDSTSMPPSGDLAGRPMAKGDAAAGQASLLSWRHRGDDWRWAAHYEQISPRFVNDNGFVPQSGIQRSTLDLTRLVHSGRQDIGGWELFLRGMQTRALEDTRSGVFGPQLVGELLQPGMWIMDAAGTEGWVYLNLDRARTRFNGPVHQPRSVLLGGGTHPGPRLTFVNLDMVLGERIDVEADRVGQGYSISTQATWRDIWGSWGVEFEQRASLGRINSPSGGAALQESSAQTKLLLHFSAEQAVRLVHQSQAFSRTGEVSLLASESSNRVTTLAWLARAGALRGWSLGASWAQTSGQATQQEIFVKFQQGWSLL